MNAVTETEAWLTTKLSQALPRDSLRPGAAGRDVRAIAEAMAAVQGPGSTAFGLHLSESDRATLHGLLPRYRDALEQWHRFLRNALGDEGARFVENIAAEYGIVLGEGSSKPVARLLDLEKLATALSKPQALRSRWEQEDQLLEPDDHIAVVVGEPDGVSLTAMKELFERRFVVPAPADLIAVLERFNGICVESSEEGGFFRSQASELGEPVLWPAGGYGDPHFLPGALVPAAELFVIGGLEDSGHLALAVSSGGLGGVYWVDLNDQSASPLAASFAEFVDRWLDSALCLPLLLRNAGVKGWQM